ncbi:MAG: hypothetical protein JSR95_13060, partial [Proteobacteria bacterium]|nr:hypothetical protein [Pseudomonadota bacterium]
MYAMRQWSVRHARGMAAFYRAFEAVLVGLAGLWRAIGHDRLEKPFAFAER